MSKVLESEEMWLNNGVMEHVDLFHALYTNKAVIVLSKQCLHMELSVI